MGTRSFIAMEDGGQFVGNYCHWDGYLTYNGRILHDHYNDLTKLHLLIDLGDLSSLNVELGHAHDFNKPTEGWTVAYGRDRGETDDDVIHPKRLTTLAELVQRAADSGCEYLYVYRPEKACWYYREIHSGMSSVCGWQGFRKLGPAVQKALKAEAKS